jgi:hypothetical protein
MNSMSTLKWLKYRCRVNHNHKFYKLFRLEFLRVVYPSDAENVELKRVRVGETCVGSDRELFELINDGISFFSFTHPKFIANYATFFKHFQPAARR